MARKATCNFGEHLTIDGYDGNPEALNSKKLVLYCLEQLPGLIGMNMLAKPKVYRAPECNKKDPGGWSGFAVILESHISIHTFPKRKFISIDVYSCRNGMDKKYIIGYFKRQFGLKKIEMHFIRRGTKYPVNNCA